MTIHPLADVSPRAELGSDVEIGPFAVVEGDVRIGDRCRLAARSTVKAGTTLGDDCVVAEGAVLGGMPQHLHQPPQPGGLVVGQRNLIRENATLHRAMVTGENTTIGDDCLIMVAAHVAHDCRVGNQVVLTNNVMLAGHVTVGDRAYLGGGSAVHQHCHVGRVAMIGGLARIDQDVLPFVMIDGESNRVVGLNKVGLRRAGIEAADRATIKEAYRRIFRDDLSFAELMAALEAEFSDGPVAEFADFLSHTTRGFVRERRRTTRPMLRIVPSVDDAHDEAHDDVAKAA